MTTKTVKFEEAMKRLEEIVNQMEQGDVELDKTLANFEEGIKLVRFCSGKLEEAKKKIEILVKKDGKIMPEEFVPDREEKAKPKPDKNISEDGLDLF